jgi:hypothetical protein
MSTLRALVEQEMAHAREQFGQEWASRFLNNFPQYLPGGWMREHIRGPYLYAQASDLLQHRTYEEFYADIDRTLAEMEFDVAELHRLQERMILTREDADVKALYTLVLPVYIRLREKGYHHYPDLTI